MIDTAQFSQFEDWIRARSYAIWESEGRREGGAEEFWLQARREIEAKLQAAINGEAAEVVPPQLTISQRPIRHDSVERYFDSDRLAA
jgi:hypothetical protein